MKPRKRKTFNDAMVELDKEIAAWEKQMQLGGTPQTISFCRGAIIGLKEARRRMLL